MSTSRKGRREEDESEREDRKEEMAWVLVGRKMKVREKTERKRGQRKELSNSVA